MKTNGNSVQIVRKCAGLSQPKFAELIGVSAPAIASIETGRLKVSPELADRISIATGVYPENVLDPWATPRYMNDDSEYSEESYKDWKNSQKPEEIDLQMCEGACDRLALLLATAAQKNRLTAILFRFDSWQQQMLSDYGLKTAYSAAAKERNLPESAVDPLFLRGHAGLIKRGKTKASHVQKRKMTPALERVRAEFLKQTKAAKSAKK